MVMSNSYKNFPESKLRWENAFSQALDRPKRIEAWEVMNHWAGAFRFWHTSVACKPLLHVYIHSSLSNPIAQISSLRVLPGHMLK